MKFRFERILDEYTIMTIENEDEKTYFVILNGQTEEISEEVYRDFIRYDSRERKRIERSKRCLTGKNIRCKENCEFCEFYRIGKGPRLNESLDKLMEEYDYDPDSDYSLEDEVLGTDISEYVEELVCTLSVEEKRIVRMIVDEEKAAIVAQEMGITTAAVSLRKRELIKKLKKNKKVLRFA